MGKRRDTDLTVYPTERPTPGSAGPKHHGLVTAVGVNEETGHALWQASCACGWRHSQVNGRRTYANRALSRHLHPGR